MKTEDKDFLEYSLKTDAIQDEIKTNYKEDAKKLNGTQLVSKIFNSYEDPFDYCVKKYASDPNVPKKKKQNVDAFLSSHKKEEQAWDDYYGQLKKEVDSIVGKYAKKPIKYNSYMTFRSETYNMINRMVNDSNAYVNAENKNV